MAARLPAGHPRQSGATANLRLYWRSPHRPGAGTLVKKMSAMQAVKSLVVAVVAVVVLAAPVAAQSPVGALAVDERQGDQWGWAVDYETTAAAGAAEQPGDHVCGDAGRRRDGKATAPVS